MPQCMTHASAMARSLTGMPEHDEEAQGVDKVAKIEEEVVPFVLAVEIAAEREQRQHRCAVIPIARLE